MLGILLKVTILLHRIETADVWQIEDSTFGLGVMLRSFSLNVLRIIIST